MKIEGKACLMKIYLGESDRLNGRPLYEEIVFEARNRGLAGATVYKGIMSFGASHSIHTMKIFALSTDMPIVIEIIDTHEKIEDFHERLNQLMDKSRKGGMVFIQDLEVTRYVKGSKYKKE